MRFTLVALAALAVGTATANFGCKPGCDGTQAHCPQCQPGQWSNGQTACQSCQENYFSWQWGSQQCEPCPNQSSCGHGSSQCECQDGAWVWNNGGWICNKCPSGCNAADTNCGKCPAGQFSDGTQGCQNCPANTFSQSGSSKCTSCPQGSTSPAGSGSCSCPNGRWGQVSGGWGCIPDCRPGCDNTQPSCPKCKPGQYSDGKSGCQPCPANTFSVGWGQDNCLPCPWGSTSPPGSDQCTSPSQKPKTWPKQRKLRRDEIVFRPNMDNSHLCPSIQTACPIGKNGGFECLDLKEELTNCGTCGNDCSAIPGVKSVGCDQGKCVLGDCQSGWRLRASTLDGSPVCHPIVRRRL